MGTDRALCRVIVLGSTGSIGTQTLEVIDHLNALHASGRWWRRYEIVGLAARRSHRELAEQCAQREIRHAAIADGGDLRPGLRVGAGAAEELVRSVECDLVVAAMSGASGLPATLAAVELGRD